MPPSGLGLAARPGLLPDASRTLAGRPDSGPYRQVGQSTATVGAGRLEIDSFTASAEYRFAKIGRGFALGTQLSASLTSDDNAARLRTGPQSFGVGHEGQFTVQRRRSSSLFPVGPRCTQI